MSSINVEVLKQLLDEFDSKQAESSEEINLVEQKIAELQHRIIACREKMVVVADDRAKVLDMMQRYGALAAQPRMTLVKPTPVMQQEVLQQVSMVSNGRPEAAPQVAIQQPAQSQMSMAAKAAAAQLRAAQQQQLQPPPPPPAAPAAPVEEDETVKNINDALRGLFR